MTNVIGHASVDIRANDKFFTGDVKRIVKRGLKDLKVDIKADLDMTQVNKKLRDFRYRNSKKNLLTFKADVDTSKLDKKMEKVWDSYDGQTWNINIDVQDSVDRIEKELERVRRDADIDSTIYVSADTSSATTSIDTAARNRRVGLDVDADGIAETEVLLDVMARDRRSTVHVNIDPRTKAAMMGLVHTISGTIPFETIKNSITGVLANFENLATKSGIITTVIGGLSAAVLKLGGNALVTGGDLSQVVGIAASAPAAIGLGAVAISALALSWKGFGKALNGTGKEAEAALKTLPKEAQAAVKGLKGVGGEIRQITQQSYWKNMGTAVQDTVNLIKGPLTTGMSGASASMAEQTKSLFQAFQDFTKSGGLSKTFSNLNQALRNSSGAIQGFTQGFLQFLDGGAEKMPGFASWLSRIGTGFASWAEEANRTGKIGEWIDQSVKSIEQLGSIVKSTTGIFSGLTKAAREAGMGGMDELTTGMARLSNFMNSSRFQTGMTQVFDGALKSMGHMGDGLSLIVGTLGRNTDKIAGFMENSGKIIGQFFKNINGLITADGFANGFDDLQKGLLDSVTLLRPGFESLGSTIGGVMKIMGSVLREMAPGLNQLFSTLEGVVNGVADGIVKVMPTINDFVQSLMGIVKAVIVPLAQGFGGLLSVFAGLPGPIKNAALAFATLAAAVKILTGTNKLAAMATSMTNFGRSVVTGQTGMKKFGTSAKNMVTILGTNVSSGAQKGLTAVKNFNKEVANSFKSGQMSAVIGRASLSSSGGMFSGVISAAKTAGGKVASGFKAGLGKVGGGALGLLGGWPGLIAIGLIAAGTFIVGKVQEQKAKIEAELAAFNDLKSGIQNSMDKTVNGGGNTTNATSQIVADTLSQTKGFSDVASKFGQNIDVIAQKATSSSKTLNKTRDTFSTLGEAISKAQKDAEDATRTDTMQEVGGSYGYAVDQLDDFTASMAKFGQFTKGDKEGFGQFLIDQGKITREELQGMQINVEAFSKASRDEIQTWSNGFKNVKPAIDSARDSIRKAQEDVSGIKQEITDTAALKVDQNFRDLTTTITTADEKFSAFKSNLNLLGRDFLGMQSANYDASVLADNVKTQFKEMKTSIKESVGDVNFNDLLYKAKTKGPDGGQDFLAFNFESASASVRKGAQKLYAVATEQSSAMQETFVKAYDQNLRQFGDTESAQQYALDSTKKMRDTMVNEFAKTTGQDKNLVAKTLGLDDNSLKMGLSLDGSKAIEEAISVQQALQLATGTGWKATLDMDSSKAKAGVMEAMNLGSNFSDQDFQAKAEILADNANMGLTDFIARFQSAPDKKQFILDLREQGLSSVESALSKIKGFDGKKFQASLKTSVEGGADIDSMLSQINGLDGKQKKVFVEAVMKGTPIQQALDSIPDQKTVGVKAELTQSIESTIGTPAPVSVPLVFKQESLFDSMVSKAQGATATVKQQVEYVPGPMPSVPETSTQVKVNYVAGAMPALPKTTETVNVKYKVGTLSLPKPSPITVSVRIGKVPSIKVPTPKAVSVSVRIGKVPSIKVPTPKAVTAVVKGNNSAAMAAVAKVNGAKISAKTLTINGNAGPALSAIARVNAARVSNKTQTITTIHRTVGSAENANGGLYMNNVRSFAKGGLDPRAIKALKSFKGGSENHRAQIAKSSTKFRIWGEPETGGEAYIPLAKAKRSRSLKILEQVAQHFGVSLSQQFANGDFLGGSSLGGGITSFAGGGTTTKTKKTATQKKAEESQKKANEKANEAFKEFKTLISEARNTISNGARELKVAFGATQKSDVQNGIAEMYSGVKDFMNKYKNDKSRKGQYKAAEKTYNTLKKQEASSKVWNKKNLKYQTVNLATGKLQTKKATSSLDISRVIAQDAIKRQRTGDKRADYNSKFTLRDYERALEKVTAELDKQKSIYENMQSSRSSLTSSISGGIAGSFNLGSLVDQGDSYGWKRTVSSSDIKTYVTNMKTKMTSLKTNLNSILKDGYNPAFVADIASMDPDAALEISNALKGDASMKKFINSNYTEMFGKKGQYALDNDGNVAGLVSGIAYDIGNKLSGELYAKGAQAQKKLVDGLTSEQKALQTAGQKYTSQLETIGKQVMDGLAKGMSAKTMKITSTVKKIMDQIPKAAKKALGIKSPSRVMANQVGTFIPEGVALGINRNRKVVDKSLNRLVDPKQVVLSIPTRSQLTSANAGESGIMDSKTNSSSQRPIEINVHPSQGLSEETIGKMAARELFYRLDSATL